MVKIEQVKVEKFEQGKKYLCEIYGTTIDSKFIFIGQLPV